MEDGKKTPQVFLSRNLCVGDSVTYKKKFCIVTHVTPYKLQHGEHTIVVPRKGIKHITVDLLNVHSYKGTTVESHLRHVFSQVESTDNLKPAYDDLVATWREDELVSVANEEHHIACKVDKNGSAMTVNGETFFMFAYRQEIYQYCDMCMQFWLSRFEKNAKIVNELSYVTQPPMNSIITTPVYCMFERERYYDRNTCYEESYVQKILDTNKTNFEIEEPAYAEQMDVDQYYNIDIGNEVCIQIDHYDAVFLNTKIMSQKQFLGFLQDGDHKDLRFSIKDHFPISYERVAEYGLHFIGCEDTDLLAPIPLFNFQRWENFILKNVVFNDNTLDSEKIRARETLVYRKDSYKETSNSISFMVTFETDQHWNGKFLIEAKSVDEPVVMTFNLFNEEGKKTFSANLNILLFVTGSEINPLRIITHHVNADYEHAEERIVKRGTVLEKMLGQDTHFMRVRTSENMEVMASTEGVNFPSPDCSSLSQRKRFHQLMSNHTRKILFPDKSYALRKVNIGLFHIPTTVYAPNMLRLSNGKIPKKIKRLSSTWKYKPNEKPYYAQFIKKIHALKSLIPHIEVVEQKKAAVVSFETILDLVMQEEYVQFHHCMNSVEFQERNKIIMKLRGKDLPIPFSKLYACIMNEKMCHNMMKKTSMMEDWHNYFQGKGKRPEEMETFEVNVEDLYVTTYVKSKLIDKIGKTFFVTPFILGMLLGKRVDEDIFEYCKNISVTDSAFYPIHFAVNFVEDAKLRQQFVIRILRSEQENEKFSFFTYSRLNRKWNPTSASSHSVLRALCEWPYDELFQSFFLLLFAMNLVTNVYKKRMWFIENTFIMRIFSQIPGFGIIEHEMKNYGYPTKTDEFIESWTRGFEWLATIGLCDLEFLTIFIDKKNVKLYCFEDDTENMKKLQKHMKKYQTFQCTLYKKMRTKLMTNARALFQGIFCSDMNVHFRTRFGTFYEYLLENPVLWDDKTRLGRNCKASTLSQFYFDECPTLHPFFETLQGVYIDLRLSLFAQTHSGYKYKSSVYLVRNGGSINQVRFIHQLLQPIKNTYTLYLYHDLHDMLSPHTNMAIFKSEYLRSKYVGHSEAHHNFPILIENIVDLLSEESILHMQADQMLTEANQRVRKVVLFLELYMKQCTHTKISASLQGKKEHTPVQVRYLNLIYKIVDVLFETSNRLYYSGQRLEVSTAALAFSFLLVSPVWSDTYMKDVRQYEYIVRTPNPSIYSHVSILFYDLLQIDWWSSWKKDMKNDLADETFRIFQSSHMEFSAHTLSNTMHFIYDFMYDTQTSSLVSNINIKRIIATGGPVNRNNYEYLGRVVMNRLVDVVRIDETALLKLDKFLETVITKIHNDSSMRKFDDGQYLYFLLAIAPMKFTSRMTSNKRKKLFNSVSEIFLRLKLPKAFLAFLKTFEKHLDYHRMNQETPHILKNSTVDYIQPNEFFESFTLNKRNTSLLSKNFYQSCDKSDVNNVFWHIVITNLHFNGLLNWRLFARKAGFSMEDKTLLEFEELHRYHENVIDHLEKANSGLFMFRKEDRYSVSFFIQNGFNPFLFDFMKCSNGSISWIEHLLDSKMRLAGWPLNMFFTEITDRKKGSKASKYNFSAYPTEIGIDSYFTCNEGVYGADYRTLVTADVSFYSTCQITNRKRKLNGKYILEASSFLGFQILSMAKQSTLTCKSVFELVEKVSRASHMHTASILMFPHAVVKSQLNDDDNVISNFFQTREIVHCKVNILSLLELLCRDFTATDLEIMLEKSGILFTDKELRKMKKGSPAQRLISADYIFEMIRNSVLFSLQFSDKIEIFKVYFHWAVNKFDKINIDKQFIFTNTIFSVQTNHTFIEERMKTFKMDMLTFAATFGRVDHFKFFVDELCRWEKPLFNLQKRVELQSTDTFLSLSGIHLYYIHSSKDPVEHLLYVCAMHGHVDCFKHLYTKFHASGLSKHHTLQLQRVFQELVRTAKFDVFHTEQTKVFLQRKREMLSFLIQLSNYDKQSCVFVARSYLQAQQGDIITRTSDFVRTLRPSFMKSRIFMRGLLQLWGQHIYECLVILHDVELDIDEPLTYKGFLNLSFFCNKQLLKFCAEHLSTSVSFESLLLRQNEIITDSRRQFLFLCNRQERLVYTFIYYFLNMELENTRTSMLEVVTDGYVKDLLDTIATGANMVAARKNVFLSKMEFEKSRIHSEEKKKTIDQFCEFFKNYSNKTINV